LAKDRYPAIPNVLAVNAFTPRAFLVAADDDTTVNAGRKCRRFFAALRAANVLAELHIYSSGSQRLWHSKERQDVRRLARGAHSLVEGSPVGLKSAPVRSSALLSPYYHLS
jgi:hypothetical protein